MKNAKAKTKLPEWPEQDTVKSHDWRLHAVTAVSEDSGGLKRGDVIKAAFPLKLGDGTTVQAGAPNLDGLILDFAAKLDVEAVRLQAEMAAEAASGRMVEDASLFEILQKRMGSAAFAFTAVESFANEVISNAYYQGFQYEQMQPSGIVAVLSHEDVLRHVSTDEKLASILPAHLKLPSPKGGVHWQNFQRLKKIRNRIIHLKDGDRANSVDKSLWEQMLDPVACDFGNQMHDLTGYYVPQVVGLNFRWFYKWPH